MYENDVLKLIKIDIVFYFCNTVKYGILLIFYALWKLISLNENTNKKPMNTQEVKLPADYFDINPAHSQGLKPSFVLWNTYGMDLRYKIEPMNVLKPILFSWPRCFPACLNKACRVVVMFQVCN